MSSNNRDMRIALKYLLSAELLILLLAGSLWGDNGIIVAAVLSVIAISWGYLAVSGMRSMYSNGPNKRVAAIRLKDIRLVLKVALMVSYLAIGVWIGVKAWHTQSALSVFFYAWALTLVAGWIANNVIISRRDPLLKEQALVDKRLKERQERLLSEAQLTAKFLEAMENSALISHYIIMVEAAVEQYKATLYLRKHVDQHIFKLMHFTTQNKQYQLASTLFSSYINVLKPQLGVSSARHGIARIAIMVSHCLSDETIYKQVEEHLLGENFNIEQVNDDWLVFNLACHYALKHDKKQLLTAIDRAIKLGMSMSLFIDDSDFRAYQNDADFLAVVKAPRTAV